MSLIAKIMWTSSLKPRLFINIVLHIHSKVNLMLREHMSRSCQRNRSRNQSVDERRWRIYNSRSTCVVGQGSDEVYGVNGMVLSIYGRRGRPDVYITPRTQGYFSSVWNAIHDPWWRDAFQHFNFLCHALFRRVLDSQSLRDQEPVYY